MQLPFPFRMEPVPGYRFSVFLNNMVMGFQKVSGIGREIQTEIFQEGGLNTKVHVFPKSCTEQRVLHLEKGVYSGMEPPFYLVGEKIPGVLLLAVTDNGGNPLKGYLFTGLLLKKWEVGELNAENNSLLIESFEICYEDCAGML